MKIQQEFLDFAQNDTSYNLLLFVLNQSLEICEKKNATEYLSGRDGKNYLNENDFLDKNINIYYQNFIHPVYSQFHEKFESNMSIIDLYFNHGPDCIKIINESNSKQLN